MAGNTFGQLFTVTSFGESHGPGLGCVVDGCPPGLALDESERTSTRLDVSLARKAGLVSEFSYLGGRRLVPLGVPRGPPPPHAAGWPTRCHAGGSLPGPAGPPREQLPTRSG
mgnify:CR=1 FL=1